MSLKFINSIMMNVMAFINWNPDPILFQLGEISLRWYSILFMSGLYIGYSIVHRIYSKENISTEKLNSLAMYIFLGTIIGARLGHCLFYDWDYFSHHIVEIFLPIRNINGHVHFTGFQGLASHGGAIGVAVAIFLYCLKFKDRYLFVLDKIAVATPLVGAFIRLGNLMNSEIIGKTTDVPWAFVFEKVDNYPRHPTQLYEFVCYALLFFIMIALYCHFYGKKQDGFLFGIFIFLLFAGRFFVEYFKIVQEDFEKNLPLNMGQLLSIPFMCWGIYLMCTKGKNHTPDREK